MRTIYVDCMIAGVVGGVNAYNKAINEGIEKSNEAYDKTSENINGIEEYKDKITELKDALADETTSEEDAYNARKQLVEIQDEIVSKYGLQKDSIDLVNGSLHILIKSFLYVYSLLYEVGI